MYVAPGWALAVPAGSLVVLAGLPGAGKTTLLRRLAASAPSGVVALDAEDVAARLRALPVAYAVLRPLVHALHLVRVLVAVAGPARCVLTTDPMTAPPRRLLLRVAAQTTGRRLHLVLIDATLAEALAGQDRRGRALGRRRMATHARRWPRLRTRRTRLAASSVALTRSRARSVRRLEVHDRGLPALGMQAVPRAPVGERPPSTTDAVSPGTAVTITSRSAPAVARHQQVARRAQCRVADVSATEVPDANHGPHMQPINPRAPTSKRLEGACPQQTADGAC